MNKIKAFFQNKIVKLVAWIVLALDVVVLIIGVVTSFLVSIVAIKFLVGYVRRHDFQVFGWYRIILGITVIGYFLVCR